MLAHSSCINVGNGGGRKDRDRGVYRDSTFPGVKEKEIEDMNKEDRSHLESIMKTFEQKLARSTDAKEQRQSEADAFYIV